MKNKTTKENLFSLSNDEKYEFLNKQVYEKIRHSHTGKLIISTHWARKVAELLGGNYDDLNKIQKDIFKSDIVFESINLGYGFEKYTKW